jgi:hypothetical protein
MTGISHPALNLTQQRQCLMISRRSLYDELTGESALNVSLVRIIDEQHLKRPGMVRVKWLVIYVS